MTLSGGALDVAIEALEAELDAARGWQSEADRNVDTARALLETGEHAAQDADTRVRNAADALEYLQGLKAAETAAAAPVDADSDDVPDGAFGADVES